MPEYLGYKPQAGVVEWSRVIGDLNSSITDALNVRNEERDAFNSIRKSNEDVINQYETGQNQTLNTLVLNGANSIRELQYKWNKAANNGEITRADYKERMNNIESYWESLSNAGKSYDKRVEETLARQQPDENGVIKGSSLESYNNKTHSQIANLKSKTIYTNPETGKIYLSTIDQNGSILDYTDVRQMNNPGNILDNRVHLTKTIADNVKSWGDWKSFTEGAMGSSRTIEDARKNPAFVSAKNSLVRSTMSSDRAVASILTDNGTGNYKFYSGDENDPNGEYASEMNTAINNAREDAEGAGIEFNEEQFIQEQKARMILVARDETGVMQPQLTEDQKKAARQRVEDEIEIQLGMKESGTVKRAPSTPTVVTPKDKAVNTALYDAVYDAWPKSSAEGRMSGNRLTTLSGGDYKFEWVANEGLKVMDISGEKAVTVAEGITQMDDISPFFWGTGTGAKGVREGRVQYDLEKEAAIAKRRSTEPPREREGIKATSSRDDNKKGRGGRFPKRRASEESIQATMRKYPNITREEAIEAIENF